MLRAAAGQHTDSSHVCSCYKISDKDTCRQKSLTFHKATMLQEQRNLKLDWPQIRSWDWTILVCVVAFESHSVFVWLGEFSKLVPGRFSFSPLRSDPTCTPQPNYFLSHLNFWTVSSHSWVLSSVALPWSHILYFTFQSCFSLWDSEKKFLLKLKRKRN